jgi:hypothetical protein
LRLEVVSSLSHTFPKPSVTRPLMLNHRQSQPSPLLHWRRITRTVYVRIMRSKTMHKTDDTPLDERVHPPRRYPADLKNHNSHSATCQTFALFQELSSMSPALIPGLYPQRLSSLLQCRSTRARPYDTCNASSSMTFARLSLRLLLGSHF